MYGKTVTFINAVLSVRMMAKLLDGLAAEETSVCGLSSERKHASAQILTVTLLTVLQTLTHMKQGLQSSTRCTQGVLY